MAMAWGQRSLTGGAVPVGVVLLLVLSFSTCTLALITNTTVTNCSNTCESQDCTDPFKLRYGKYCGIGYTGCNGTQVCDGLDACCRTHDKCIGPNLENYVNRTCNENLRNCVQAFQSSNGTTFPGATCSASDVEKVIITSMDLVTGSRSTSPPRLINLPWVTMAVFILSLLLLDT